MNHIFPSSSIVTPQEPLFGPVGSLRNAARRPADAERVVGRVNPVVEAPDEAGLLVFEIAVAAEADAGEDMLALVGDAVVVGVGVLDHVVRGRFVGQDAVAVERHDRPRQHELVDEHGALVVDAVVLRALEARDAAFGRVLIVAVGVAHVGRELGDVHPAVAVEADDRRADDVGLGQHELHAVPGRRAGTRGLFLRRSRLEWRLRREISAGVGRRRQRSAGRRRRGGACWPAAGGAGFCKAIVRAEKESARRARSETPAT